MVMNQVSTSTLRGSSCQDSEVCEVILAELAAEFPSSAIDIKTVAKSIKEAFPESVSRVSGKSRT